MAFRKRNQCRFGHDDRFVFLLRKNKYNLNKSTEENQEEVVNYREEILRLVSEGKIKHTTKYVKKASDETLEKIYKSYIAKQLDETNEQITNILIEQMSEILTSLEGSKKRRN